MRNRFKQTILVFNACLFSSTLFAQSTIDQSFHANGSIWVVIAVAAIVLIGLFVYLFYLDRKVKTLEERHKRKKEE